MRAHAVPICLALLVSTLPAAALRTPDALVGHPAFELAEPLAGEGAIDAGLRGSPRWGDAPRALRGAHERLAAVFGPGFRAAYDTQTGLLRRAYGPGIVQKGSVASEVVAERVSRALLEQHLDLFAPGAQPEDFVLVANDLDAGMRTVGFRQTLRGMSVRSAQLSFRFKNDKLFMIGAEAFAAPKLEPVSEWLDQDIAKERALAHIESEFGASEATTIGAPVVLPLRGTGGQIKFVATLPVEVRVLGEALRFSVFVDANSGEVLAREQTLRFASATIAGRVPERSPSFGPRIDVPLALTNTNIEAAAQKSGLDGSVNWSGASPTALEVLLSGDRARVLNDTGPEATFQTSVDDGQSYLWDASADETVDAQVAAYVSSSTIREYAKGFAPTLGFLNQQVKATVNINDVCNAFSDGTTINFYKSGSGCENTGRIADVVFHEYGHSIHAHAIIEGVGAFDGALSEGLSDFLAATYTGDPGTARGFFLDTAPLRDLDPPNQENRWPNDLVGEVHYDGLIIGQALWDMRKELVSKLGQTEGVQRSNELFYQGMRRAVDIPSMHLEILAADDDDGDLTNGTPNVCEINRAFARHGLVLFSAKSSTIGVLPPTQSGFDISVELEGLFEQCSSNQITDATLDWQQRGVPGNSGILPMNANGNLLSATIPGQDAGLVIRYGVAISFTDGGTLNLPDNAADPRYEFFVGDILPLYCTDFESDPEADGWTHGLLAGEMTEGADDWGWGKANGSNANGDPIQAFSGERVIGNDLVPEPNFNGLYQPDKTNFMRSPVVATQGHKNVRLQYRRWLNVEDGFFDQATIRSGDQVLWSNLDRKQGDASKTHHRDLEWRFQDVDLSNVIDADGNVQVTFQLQSDGGLEFGGWTIDDFCIVAVTDGSVDPCADGSCGGAGAGGGDGGGAQADGTLEPTGGCGCAVPGRDGPRDLGAWGLSGLGLLGLGFFGRRRRRHGSQRA